MKRTTLSLSLTPELDKYLTAKVASGLYQTSSEVVREALRLMRERDALYEQRVAQIRRDLEEGYQQALRGETMSGEDARDELQRRRKEWLETHS